MAAPTKEAIIGTFINGRNAQDDFLQLATNHGGTVFAWIDYQGNLQGTFATSALPAGTNSEIQFNSGGVFGADAQLLWDNTNKGLYVGVAQSVFEPSFQNYLTATQVKNIFALEALPGGQFANLFVQTEGVTAIPIGIYNAVNAHNQTVFVYNADLNGVVDTGQTVGTSKSINLASTWLGPGNVTTHQDFFGSPTYSNSAIVTNSDTYFSNSVVSGGSVVTNNIDFHAGLGVVSGGTVVNEYAFYAADHGGQATTFSAAFYAASQTADGHSFAFYSAGGNNFFGGTATTVTSLSNITAATNVLNQSSPILTMAGTIWNGAASVSDTWAIQNIVGTGTNPANILTFTHTGSSGTASVSLSNLVVSGNVTINNSIAATQGAFNSQSGSAGSVFVVTSVANAVGSLTTYQVTIPAGQLLVVGQYVTIAGFTSGVNNGRFIVSSSTTTTLVVFNSAGSSETHAATATVDNNFISQAGFDANLGLNTNFSISGTIYKTNAGFEALPFNPQITLNVKGDATDAAYLRIVNDATTGNHGLEIGGIIDGSGASPVTVSVGHFNGISSVSLNNPLSLTGSSSSTATGYLSIGSSVATPSGGSGSAVTTNAAGGSGPAAPTVVVGYIQMYLAAQKIWVPYFE